MQILYEVLLVEFVRGSAQRNSSRIVGVQAPAETTSETLCDIIAMVRFFMRIIFEWDRSKAHSNYAKHRVSFAEARTVFLDPFALTEQDEQHSDDEVRLISIGISSAGRLLTVVHTEIHEVPDTLVVRLISSRKATTAERRNYEQKEK